MKRKQVYDKIIELNLQETVKKECGRNYTQVSTFKLEEIINKASKVTSKPTSKPTATKKAEVKKEVKTEEASRKPKSTEERLAKLIEILGRKRILLQSEIEELV